MQTMSGSFQPLRTKSLGDFHEGDVEKVLFSELFLQNRNEDAVPPLLFDVRSLILYRVIAQNQPFS